MSDSDRYRDSAEYCACKAREIEIHEIRTIWLIAERSYRFLLEREERLTRANGRARSGAMPITPFLDGNTFDPETKRIMGIAFEMTCTALGLTDRGDPANGIVAKRIIELAKAGERNPDLLCERVLLLLRGP
jgi:hypothetical protein